MYHLCVVFFAVATHSLSFVGNWPLTSDVRGIFLEEFMIDYAFPTMMAEKALKDLHYAMLRNDYTKALEAAAEALEQTKEAVKSIEHMRKNNS